MDIKKWNELPGSAAVQGWPYTNLHDLNLDWIINTTKEFAAEISRFEDNVTEEVTGFEERVTVKIGEFEGTIQEYTERMDTALATVDEKITYIDNFFSSLDVQQEINNKLNSMSADGSLAALLKPFADAYMQQDAPGVISAWLAANISEPVGVVIDKSLSVPGAAADAASVGERLLTCVKNVGVNGYQGGYIDDADNAVPNSIYSIFATEPDHYPTHLPCDNLNETFLITFVSYVKYNDTGDKAFWTQLVTDKYFNILFIRRRITGFGSPSWGTWEKMAYNPIINNRKFDIFTNCYSDADNLIVYDNAVTGKYCDINDGSIGTNADYNYVITQVQPGISYTITGNVKGPALVSFYKTKNIGTETFISGIERQVKNDAKTNVEAPTDATYAAISYNKNEPYMWFGLTGKYIDPSIKNNIRTGALQPAGVIGYSGTALLDADNADPNSIYKTFSAESQYYAQNLPKNINGYLFTFRNETQLNNMQFWSQVLVDEGINAYAYRTKVVGYGSEQWDEWRSIGRSIYVKKDGTGDFAKITDALAYGAKNRNTTIYVDNGVYDIIDELGTDYFENFTYVPYSNMGPKIGNGTHLICSPSAKIVCHYTGTNTEVINGFSPLNPICENTNEGLGDFIIEGLDIEVSNVRYVVHDDFGAQSIPVVHKYKRCRMVYNGANQCIGSGMGKAGDILMEDCYFNTTVGGEAIFIHNTDGFSSAQSAITIKNCYIDGTGYLHFYSIGKQPENSMVLVSGNSFGGEIRKTTREGDRDNMKLLEWNNVIRN